MPEGSSKPVPRAAGAAPADDAAESLTIPIGTSLADAERQLILATLKHLNNQRERTAAALGISLKTLHNKLNKLRLRPKRSEES